MGKIGKQSITDTTCDIGKSVAVKEKKWCGAMEKTEQIESFDQATLLGVFDFPAALARASSL
jgi:hypothetical protein